MKKTEFDHKSFLKNLTGKPGVYRMLDEANDVLYVGKAKNLKNRVSSYFRSAALDSKTLALVSRIYAIEVTVTASETEALLLEQSLIKELKPPYNIVFRDDKSYPYIYLSSSDEYPRLAFHRGAKKRKGKYFGPFPSAYSVRDSLNILQKVFRVRQCEDTFFKNRSRPCLQYQINRCSGPCCDLVSREDYAEDVQHAVMFLEGKSNAVLEDYANKMDEASTALQFEKAAHYRDQVVHLRKIQEQQYVVGKQGDIDVMVAKKTPGGVCVLVMFIRGGRMLGNKNYFPSTRLNEDEGQILTAFIPQFYLSKTSGREIPKEIVVNARLADKALFVEALSVKSQRKVAIADNVRSHRKRWINIAVSSAEQALGSHLANRNNIGKRFESLQEALQLDAMPQRLECFDVSHSSGEATVASCVVFDTNGPLKSDYRRFNIDGITPGDDYAAMSQALKRRYTRIKKGEGVLPDILLIDGGKGQLHEAEKIMEELQIIGVTLVGVAKGPTRKAGLEILFVSEGSEIHLPPDNPGLHLIQHIRDESHRFAITAHRNRRGKKRTKSVLETIDGVGPKRRRALLRHFGGSKQVQGASMDELARVESISEKLAEHIYATLHNG
ncbi:MAG: excinuclease ABC subunit UvrC [Gammaproteobacteria bacterium]|nr:excinuclease ABC subunit UvrC [Gammaproteobacteria bacterium]